MNRLANALKQLLQLDRRVFYSFIFRASQAIVGVITILVITHWFQPVEQGYYYTFASLLALQIVFEMGLSFVILQFTSHEFATLAWSKERQISGPPEKLAAFEVFLATAAQVYGMIALVMLVIICPVGLMFFAKNSHDTSIVWILPWIILCISTAANVFLIPFLSVIEGSGLIVKINQFKTIQNTAGAIGMWIGMIAGAHLYSIAIDSLICLVITLAWLAYYYPDLVQKTYQGALKKLSKTNTVSINWREEIWPMQWRIAISWISGYFLSQIYPLILFYYHDAVSAGKFGASMTVCSMLSLFAATFLTAHNPEMCQLIAKEQWQSLYALYRRIFIQSLGLTLLLAAGIYIGMLLPFLSGVTHRFVSPSQMLLLLAGTVISYMIGAIAQFLRAFKREPFVWVSLIGALLNAFLAWWFGSLYGATGIVWVYLLLNLMFGLPTAWWLWRRNTKALWVFTPAVAFKQG